jgi:hypothetical protein
MLAFFARALWFEARWIWHLTCHMPSHPSPPIKPIFYDTAAYEVCFHCYHTGSILGCLTSNSDICHHRKWAKARMCRDSFYGIFYDTASIADYITSTVG